MDIKHRYEHIINGPTCVSVFDCDSTVVASKMSSTDEVISTGEGLSDVALALGRRLGNPHIMEEVDGIVQQAMSTPGAVFVDSLNARFEILKKYGLQKGDIEAAALEALLSPGFAEFIRLKDWLKIQNNLQYQPYFFLSGGFYEMLETCLLKVVDKSILPGILFSNRFSYSGQTVTGFDRELSLMYLEGAKKTMVEKLRLEGRISSLPVSGVGDGSNDISMSDEGLFIAYSGVKRREKVVVIAGGVEARDFYEVAVFHTSPEERRQIYDSGSEELIAVLERGKESLKQRVSGINIV